MAGHTRRLAAPVLVMLLLGLTGCGSDDGTTAQDEPTVSPPTSAPVDTTSPSPTDAETTPPPDWPACGKVWVAGADLPRPYDGCLEGDEPVAAEPLKCSAGVQLVTYADRFWGVPGHRISRADGSLRRDAEFRRTRDTCQA